MSPELASRLMPLARLVDAESAHRLAVAALARGLIGPARRPADPRLACQVMGLGFANPLGLAAGFDKQAEAIRPLFGLGFGFVEVGGVTLRPQPGNARPRVFRLSEDAAVINRYGLNSDGWPAVRARIEAVRAAGRLPGPLWLNVGLNKESADPNADYAALLADAAPLLDVLVVNVSSPNTPGLRDLQAGARLGALLDTAQAALAAGGSTTRLLVKIAPDLDDEALSAIVETAIARGVDGLVIGNTTIARPPSLRSRHAGETGGLSGRPLFAPSTTLLARAARLARGRLVLVGVGGIASGRDAYAKIRAGASLVQLYTAFAYQGPALIGRLLDGLAAALAADGFTHVADAVGADLKDHA
ncbi:quinone-dependent dihydroorotate dehydrogenase [Elioraea tepidiphila]|uniref:quinone-dependent dihydroorotate dehydrogenase n=1 Tax=Elioraea tepidiphila TaxID=457934 RepID=UPI00035E0008|nr:quinone-dependent dihydroorotate dehydrogenase [Elioraea tepidiphila]